MIIILMVEQLRTKFLLESSIKSRIILFLGIGGASTLISVFGAEILYQQTHMPLWLATVPMTQVAIIFKWIFNHKLTWGISDNLMKRFWLHELSCLAGVVFQLIAIAILSATTTAPSLVILGIGVITGTGINFAINEKIVFVKEMVEPAIIE